MADRYWVGGTGTWNSTSTTNWASTSGGSPGASAPTTSDNVFFDSASGSNFRVTVATLGSCLNLAVVSGVNNMTLAGSAPMTISGDVTFPSSGFSTTYSGTITFNALTARTLDTKGINIPCSVIFNGSGGSWALQSNFTCSGASTTLTNGTLNLNNFTYSTLIVSSSSATSRSIAFGTTGKINISGTGTVWNTATVAGFTHTGTSNINIVTTGSTACTITAGAMSSTQALNFNISGAGTYLLTLTASSNFRSLNFTGFAGSFTLGGTVSLYGDLILASTMTSTLVAQTLSFIGSSVTQTLTSAGVTLGFAVLINGTSNIVRLTDAMNQATTRGFTLQSGTLDMNLQSANVGALTLLTGTKAVANGTLNAVSVTHTSGDISVGAGYNIATTGTYTLTAGNIDVYDGVDFNIGTLSSAGTSARSFYFDNGGRIVISGSGAIWNTSATFNITYIGGVGGSTRCPIVVTYAGSAAVTVTTSTMGGYADWKFTAGTYTLTLTGGGWYNTIDFTGFSGTMAQGSSVITLFGVNPIKFSPTMSTSTSTGTYVLSGSGTITTNGITISQGFDFNSPGQLFSLADNFIQSSTARFVLTNGTVDFNNKSYSLGILTFVSGTRSYINYGAVLNPPAAITLTSGTLDVGIGSAALSTPGTFTYTAGTLNINNGATFDVGTLVSTTTSTRVINFSAGSSIETNNAGTAVNFTGVTGFSFTGTSQIKVNNPTSTATTVTLTGASASAMNLNIVSGTYALTLTNGNTYRNLDFTGFSGSVALSTNTYTVWGNIVLSTGMTITGTAGTAHFAFTATSGTRTITTNGVTANFGINMNGNGQTLALGSAFVQGTGHVFNYTNGTFDLAGYSTSIGTFVIATGTHAITNGTINCLVVNHNSGNLVIGTGYTLVCSGTYTLTIGAITMNDGVSLVVGAFSSSNSNSRSVAFGTSGSTITVTGTGTAWNLATPTNFSYTGTPVVNMTYAGATAMTVTSPLTAISFNFTAGTYTLTITSGAIMQNLDFTGFAGTWAQALTNLSLLGNLTFGAGMSVTSGGGVLTMTPPASTARTISTVDVTNIVTFANITINAAAAGSSVRIASSQVVVNNVVLTAGTLDLNNNRLALFSFSSANSNTRTIAYGTTGEIYMFGSGTVWNTSTTTGFSFTGTSNNNLATAVVAACTLNPGALSTTQAMNFRVSGSGVTLTTTTGGVYRNLDFTGFTGTWAQAATNITIIGDLIFSSRMTSTSSTGVATLGGSNDTLLVGNGHNSNILIYIVKTSATAKVTLGSAYTQTLNNYFSLRTGILDTNNYNLTLSYFQSAASGGATTRSLILGSSTVTITGSSFAWSTDSGLTVDAGTSTITLTSTSTKTFTGADKAYYNLNQGGVGALTISGSNSFNDIVATARPSTVILTSGTTQTVSNFTLSGTAGNLVTLQSSTAGSPATLSKSSGTVSVSYLSIKDTTATGGATWNAFTSNGNADGGGNTGWNFISAVAAAVGAFFAFF